MEDTFKEHVEFLLPALSLCGFILIPLDGSFLNRE